MTVEPGKHLAQYRLIEKIGEGGMGVVWKGHDTRLGRDVAIKILPEALAADRDRLGRFEREARLLAALNHPNIVTLYNVEQADGQHFLVMELIAGRTLDRVIPVEGLSAEMFLDIALPLASAVAAAHERSITHRDLKPANVIVSDDGRLRVLDFGLAKLIRGEHPTVDVAETATLGPTRPGVVLGTWAYMSPEQAEGQTVDARTDVFSLGVLLYEMATGQRPFAGDNPARLLSSILRDTPIPIAERRSDLSPSIGQIVQRCLEKDPARRFADTGELAAALEGRRRDLTSSVPWSSSPNDPQSIAVLPFANMSSDAEHEFFSDGITEEIINALSAVKGLRVAARTSAFSFKGRAVDIAEIARKLNVGNVLEGSVRRAGNRLRITAQLVDVADGCHLWSERFDREMDDIFAIQDEIATAIAGKFVQADRVGTGGPLIKAPTRNLEAYEAYLRGRHAYERFATDLFPGLEHFERAVQLDPEFGAAWAGVAETYVELAFTAAMHPHIAMPKSHEAAMRALAIDNDLAEAHCALGLWQFAYARDWAAAEASLRRSMKLNPSNSLACHHYGHLYSAFVSFRLDEGIELCRRACEVDPLGGLPRHGWMANLYVKGELDEAIDRLNHELERDPGQFHLRRLLGLCYLERKNFNEAKRMIENAVRASGRHLWAVAELGVFHARTGAVEQAQACQDELIARARTTYIQETTLAMIPANMQRFDEAFDWLDRGVDVHDSVVFCVTSWPVFRPLRDDPRFDPLLRRLNLRRPPDAVG